MISTNQNQSARLLQCEVSADTADMIGVEPDYEFCLRRIRRPVVKYKQGKREKEE